MVNIIKNLKLILGRKQKIRIIILFLMMIFGALLESIGIALLPTLLSGLMSIDELEKNQYVIYICEFFEWNVEHAIIMLIILLIVLYVTKGLYTVLQCYVLYSFINNNRYRMQSQLMESYLNRDYSYYMNVRSGDVIQNLTNNIDFVFTAVSSLMNFFAEIVMIIIILGTIVIINPIFSIGVGGLLFILMMAVGHFIKPIMAKSGNQVNAGYKNMNKWILQSIGGIKDIKIGQREDYFLENYNYYGKITAKSRQKNAFYENVPKSVYETVTMVSVLIILLLIFQYRNNFASIIPQFAAFGVAVIKVIPSANRLSTFRNSMEYYSGGLKDVVTFILESQKEFIERENKKKEFNLKKVEAVKISFDKCCELDHITYKYPGGEKEILSDACMVIPIGKSVGIVGPSGAGKSTAADILLGLLKPQEGAVRSDGINIEENYTSWLSHVGYIPQTIYMLDDDIKSNVAFGFNGMDISEEKIWEALDEACIGDFVRGLPQGLETNIGERGLRLSGGQRQRLGIARALYGSPDILVFDEATSALDNQTERDIIESIDNLHGKKTLVIIAHRLTTIEKCDLVYKVENGTISLEKDKSKK